MRRALKDFARSRAKQALNVQNFLSNQAYYPCNFPSAILGCSFEIFQPVHAMPTCIPPISVLLLSPPERSENPYRSQLGNIPVTFTVVLRPVKSPEFSAQAPGNLGFAWTLNFCTDLHKRCRWTMNRYADICSLKYFFSSL